MTIKERFRKYDITIDGLINTAIEMYIEDPRLGDKKKIRKALRREFEKSLKDINIASLVTAGFLLEDELQKGNIGEVAKKKYLSDPVDLIADEILGIQIALYIAGSRSIFEFERFDRAKPGILKNLPPILDDVIGGLISGVLVKVCSK
ncbi:MAG: phosphatidylglycerophosphatase A [Candidatus Omnitrophica bacterium]|nr:phosphatidylglycerophosphatase A [Candidatus Omnitrophota bacterium]